MTSSREITMRQIGLVPHTRASSAPAVEDVPGMELHLDRLRRNRDRRVSRFSTISATPTAVEASTTSTVPAAETSQPARPTIREVVRKHPRNVTYFSTLVALFVGALVGWAIYLSVRPVEDNRRDGFRGGLVINGLFIVLLIVLLLLATRQAIFIYRLFRPIPPNRNPTLPPWLVGRPPTYSEALRGRGTGDVEDNIIAQNESLPKYGETRGSTLLARSQSRGGAIGREEAERISMEEMQAAEREANDTQRPVSASTQPDLDSRPPPRDQAEAEQRQIEDARRLQAAAGYSGTDEKATYREATGDAGYREGGWEDVALARDETRAPPGS